MKTYRNPAHLVGLTENPALDRLMRACGVEESCLSGRASDYERFRALSAAMPLCQGHPEAEQVQRTLTLATGLTAPLCPHTAPFYWNAWVDRFWYGREGQPADLPPICPLCPTVEPTVWREYTVLPDPTAIQAADLAAWSAALEADWGRAGTHPLLLLPRDYAFVRPDPYHAGLAVGKVWRGENLTREERDLLLTQALRVWGLAVIKKQAQARPDPPPILLEGGSPEAVAALLSYLQASRALPVLIWIPRDPAHSAAVSGLFACVKTGYAVENNDPPEKVETIRRSYAAVAPVGVAVILMK